MIAENDIGQLKARLDILELAREQGLELKAKGSDYFGLCPFHEDRDASLSISPQKGLYHCFGCGAKGNAIQLWSQLRGVSFPEAFAELSAKVGSSVAIVNPSSTDISNSAKPDYDLLASVWQAFLRHFNDSEAAQQYLRGKRGLGKLDLQGVAGYCPDDFGHLLASEQKERLEACGLLNAKGKPFFAHCVVFALRDAKERVISFYGRRIRGRGTHYYLPGERRGVFGLCNQRGASGAGAGSGGLAILVEGVIDALSVCYCGFENVLSLHGTNGWTEDHLRWLQDHQIHRVALLLDGDPAGQRSQKMLYERLRSEGFAVQSLELSGGEDPNSYFCSHKPDVAYSLLVSMLGEDSGYSRASNSDDKSTADKAKTNNTKTKVSDNPESCSLREEGDFLYWKSAKVEVQISGLSLANLDRLRLTLRFSLLHNPDVFHIDALDLYSARQRKSLAIDLCSELGLSDAEASDMILELVQVLDARRLELKAEDGLADAKHQLSDAEKTEALRALKSDSLVSDLLEDFAVCGAVGEEKAKLLGYVGTISRFLEKPLGVLIISRSGAGKTTLQESFCNFVPEEDLRQYTRLSAQSLFYSQNGGLKHKVLAIEEEEGAAPATYSIRTLQSSQRLKASTTRTDPKTGRMVSEDYSVEGPVFIVISTTNPDALDYETKNRFVILTVDESQTQTENILAATRQSYTMEGLSRKSQKDAVLRRCRNMQRLLRPLAVVNPYAPVLHYPASRLQMRREFKKYMTLINCIALLHQYQRPVHKHPDFGEYIEVMPSDIALANELVQEFFGLSVDELAPHTRRLAQEIMGLVKSKEGECVFSRKELRDFSGWSDWHIRKALEQLEEMEYIRRISGKNGSTIRYELMEDATQDHALELKLTSPEELEALLARYKGCA